MANDQHNTVDTGTNVDQQRRRVLKGTAAGVVLAAPLMDSVSGRGLVLRAAKAQTNGGTQILTGTYGGTVNP